MRIKLDHRFMEKRWKYFLLRVFIEEEIEISKSWKFVKVYSRGTLLSQLILYIIFPFLLFIIFIIIIFLKPTNKKGGI